MKRNLFSICALLAMLLSLFPRAAHAQFLGYTSPQTGQQTLANGTTCTGTSQIFPVRNFGQTQHQATATVAGTVRFTMQFFGVDNQGNANPISEVAAIVPTGIGSNGVLQAVGYFPVVQLKVICTPGTGTFTLNYSGSSSSPVFSSGSYGTTLYDKPVFSGQTQTGTSPTVSLTSPTFNSSGLLVFTYSGLPAGALGSITVQCGTEQLNSLFQPNSFSVPLQNSTTAQIFPVPSMPCPFPSVSYGAPGTPNGTFSLEYLFYPAGTPPGASAVNLSSTLNSLASLTEKGSRWTQVSTPAAGSLATASRVAGASAGNVRHVADCVNYSAGAIAAPAATALQINLRDGASGAGAVLWSITVVAPAAAGQHVNGHVCGLNLLGSLNTAMTLEFSSLLASESESVTLTGYDVD